MGVGIVSVQVMVSALGQGTPGWQHRALIGILCPASAEVGTASQKKKVPKNSTYSLSLVKVWPDIFSFSKSLSHLTL